MKIVELTDTEAFLISEVFESTAYPEHPLRSAVINTADDCGVLHDVGLDNIAALFESIWNKTK